MRRAKGGWEFGKVGGEVACQLGYQSFRLFFSPLFHNVWWRPEQVGSSLVGEGFHCPFPLHTALINSADHEIPTASSGDAARDGEGVSTRYRPQPRGAFT